MANFEFKWLKNFKNSPKQLFKFSLFELVLNPFSSHLHVLNVSQILLNNFCIWRKFGTVQIFRELAMPNFGRAQWPTAPGRAPRSRPTVAATWPASSAASVARPTAGEPCPRRPRALPRPWLIISCAARGPDGRAISRRPEAPSSADWPPAVIASRQRLRRFCRALTRQPGA